MEIAWERLEVLHASTSQADENFRGTSGSMSVTTLYDPLRQAAATLREMLRTEAAKVLDQPVDALVARDGGFDGYLKLNITYTQDDRETNGVLQTDAEGGVEGPWEVRYIDDVFAKARANAEKPWAPLPMETMTIDKIMIDTVGRTCSFSVDAIELYLSEKRRYSDTM